MRIFRGIRVCIFLASVIFLMAGCTPTNSSAKSFSISSFASKYEDAYKFSEIAPVIVEYLNEVENAYINSDKSTYSTFKVDTELLEECADAIEEYSSSILSYAIKNGVDGQLELSMVRPILEIQVKVAEKDLFEAVGKSTGEEWFAELRDALDAAYEMYTGTE